MPTTHKKAHIITLNTHHVFYILVFSPIRRTGTTYSTTTYNNTGNSYAYCIIIVVGCSYAIVRPFGLPPSNRWWTLSSSAGTFACLLCLLITTTGMMMQSVVLLAVLFLSSTRICHLISGFDFFTGSSGDFFSFGHNPAGVTNSQYYSILGIEQDADVSQIKRAYRRLAMKMHPDRGGDAEKFKQLNEAYETLSDPVKRQKYDEGGTGGGMFDSSNAPTAEDINAFFGHTFYNQFSFGGNGVFGGGGHASRQRQGFPVRKKYGVELPLKDFFLGKQLELQLDTEIVALQVEPGMESGASLNLKVGGSVITLVLVQQEHPVFKRAGTDLYSELSISLQEALFGIDRMIEHVDGTQVPVRSFSGEDNTSYSYSDSSSIGENQKKGEGHRVLAPDDILVIEGQGMPFAYDSSTSNSKTGLPAHKRKRGNLYLKIKVKFPSTMWLRSKRDRALLRRLLDTSHRQRDAADISSGKDDFNIEGEAKRVASKYDETKECTARRILSEAMHARILSNFNILLNGEDST